MWLLFNAFVVSISVQCAVTALSGKPATASDGYRRVSNDGVYKVHAEPRSWNDAYDYCTLENAELFYPKSLVEAKLVIELLQEKFPRGAESWVGAHDMFTPSSFVDLEGREISTYFAPWGPNEPSHGGWYGTCVMMHPDGSIDDQQCSAWRPFVCKKAFDDKITYNSECDTNDGAYKKNGDSKSCYKVHKVPKSWADAYLACEAEKAHLAIVDDQDEADFIVNEIKPLFEEIPGNYNKTLISVGFHDKFKEGFFLTIKGKNLNTVYNNWASGQPDDEFGSDDCGAISVAGQLHDMPCDNQRTLFVCERDISHIKTDAM